MITKTLGQILSKNCVIITYVPLKQNDFLNLSVLKSFSVS